MSLHGLVRRRASARGAEGFTLLEMLVVLAVLGVSLSVVAVSWPDSPVVEEPGSPAASLNRARLHALLTRTSVTVTLRLADGSTAHASALPDGRVLGGQAFGVAELTGESERHGVHEGGPSDER